MFRMTDVSNASDYALMHAGEEFLLPVLVGDPMPYIAAKEQ